MKIPKARKLRSGQWHIQLRLGGESISITEPTEKRCRQTAQMVKAEYLAGKRQSGFRADKTLGEVIDAYIEKYEAVLSPSTVAGYLCVRRNRFGAYKGRPVSEIPDWQAMINRELETKSEHTVRNAWGLVTAALKDAGYPVPAVKLAKVPVREMPFLEPEEIPLFLAAIEGDLAEVELLLELHGLRESEALALVRNNSYDLKRRVLRVSGAIVAGKDGLVQKETNKTKSSTRSVPIMIPRLYTLLKQYADAGKPIPVHSPSTLLRHVHSACRAAGITDVTNHGLRHTFASLAYSQGLSERQCMELGGWDDPTTMHKIYIRLAQRDKDKAKNAISDFFEAISG